MKSILTIGKDNPILSDLKKYLVSQGFEMHLVYASDVDQLDSLDPYGLCLLDVTQSENIQDSVDALAATEAQALPLVLFASGKQLDDLSALEGIEDFLLDLDAFDVLGARLRFICKRLNQDVPGQGMTIGALEINVDRYEILLEGEPLELTYKEFELFKFLATHAGRVFSRDQLLNQVWGYDFIGGTRTVDVHIRRLRAKLGPKYASLIDTVRNVGYKFLERL